MGIQKVVISDLQRTWRRSLLVGIGVSIISLMLGLFFQTVFYEIASSIPFVYRQDAHVSLPLCNIFTELYGCYAQVGLLTGLELWNLSLQIGQISALLVNLVLISIFSMWITIRTRNESTLAGLFNGLAGLFASLVLALAFDVPLNIYSPWGIYGILMLLLLPVGGVVGGRAGRDRIARQPFHRAVYFLPVDEAVQLPWGGESLSQREVEILALVAEGLTNQEIAKRLYISKATVKTHLIHIFEKLQVENRTAAVTRALACGILWKEEKEIEPS